MHKNGNSRDPFIDLIDEHGYLRSRELRGKFPHR
jgi:hypothetical protein